MAISRSVVRLVGQQVLVGKHARHRTIQTDEVCGPRQIILDGCDGRNILLRHQQDTGSGIVDDVHQLWARKTEVQWNSHQTTRFRAPVDFHVTHAILCQNGNPISFLEPQPHERPDETIHSGAELAKCGPMLAVNERGFRWIHHDVASNHVTKDHRPTRMRATEAALAAYTCGITSRAKRSRV